MNNAVERASKSEEAVEKALGDILDTTKAHKYSPPNRRSIREMVEEIEEGVRVVNLRVEALKNRLDEFYRLQNTFYVGESR